MTMTLQELSDNMEIVLAKLKVNDSTTLQGLPLGSPYAPTSVPARDDTGDGFYRTIRTKYPSQSVIPKDASLAFRVDAEDNNYLRFASHPAVLEWLGTVKDSEALSGRTLSDLRQEVRFGLVPTSTTVNGHRLETSFYITAADIGLGNTPNFQAVSGLDGYSTSLLATQKAAYDAACAPRLEPERKRKVTVGKEVPLVPGEDGEIFILL